MGSLRLIRRIPLVGFLLSAWDSFDEQAVAFRNTLSPEQHAVHIQKIREVLLVAAVLLVLGYGIGDRPFFEATFGPIVQASPSLERYHELLSFTYWSVCKILGYGLLPALHLRIRGERVADYGLSFRSLSSVSESIRLPWGRTYLILFAGILPLVFAVSFTPAFQQSYPFYEKSGRSVFDFVVWEVEYLLTFVAVEFFFRGYLLFGLRRYLGSLSLFVSMVPYALIHVLKPTPEALGSIFAGLLLGTLALCTGTLWSGVLLHVSVALSMDVLSSLQTGRFPKF
ncbi:MAG TPA: CPBP family glutamic-type intramembrane protease [Pseudomonadota bacterium]|jgi:hypothetical protein|nr:CPBP family glutamic-type intramembrane protease [Pseudomonadota bacterium]